MDIVQIGLEKLVAHRANANVMSREFMAKLRRHIEGHGHYEPLVVRKHPQKEGYFELINPSFADRHLNRRFWQRQAG